MRCCRLGVLLSNMGTKKCNATAISMLLLTILQNFDIHTKLLITFNNIFEMLDNHLRQRCLILDFQTDTIASNPVISSPEAEGGQIHLNVVTVL